MLYFAYGMNTNADSMAQRCPDALSLGHARLLDHSFRFAVHADVVRCSGSYVDGVLWQITDRCLAALDILEGYPSYYRRAYRRTWHQDRIFMAMTYYMPPMILDQSPSAAYFDMIVEGYQQHGVPCDQLYNARDTADLMI
jgi:gamma-glutamylcyclotransferase